jgi:hypothetical protein
MRSPHLYTKAAPAARRIFDHQWKTTFEKQSDQDRETNYSPASYAAIDIPEIPQSPAATITASWYPSRQTVFRLCGPTNLRGKIIRERLYFRGWMRPGWVDCVHLDGIELIFGKNPRKLATLELCPAHPLRNDCDAEAGLDAGHDTIGGGDLNSTLDIDR